MARIFRYQIVIAFSFLVLCSSVSAYTGQADSPGPALTVLVYNPAHVPKNVLDGAFEEAARIFRHAGLSTRWLDCSETAVLACRQLAGPEIVVVRIVPKADAQPDHDTFGIAYLSAEGHGTYTTVFYDRVERMRMERRTNLADLVGHVAAHELGHLLLGPNSHTPTGIMCAQWQARELHQLSRGNLLFTTEQAARLRTGVRKRHQAVSTEGISGLLTESGQ